MRDCPYIPFKTLRLEGRQQTQIIHATVWRRGRLAKGLGLSEQQLVEWFILIGNDYTNHYMYQSSEGKQRQKSLLLGQNSGNESKECPLKTKLESIQSQHPSYRLSSRYPGLENAIQYSRAVYDMLDLTSFESDGTTNNVAKSSEEEEAKCKEAMEACPVEAIGNDGEGQ